MLVSSWEFPFSTVVQDNKTFLKIHQFCVGSVSSGPTSSFSSSSGPEIEIEIEIEIDKELPPIQLSPMERAKRGEFTMKGKLGSIRYVHQFEN